jgi:signal transduction histidine kinase
LPALAAGLIAAQEQERTRIARELHDDINQRIAMLSVDLSQFQQNIPGSDQEVRSRVNKLQRRLSEIGIEIQGISHRLHSSKLEYLGLARIILEFERQQKPPLLQTCCRDNVCSNKRGF